MLFFVLSNFFLICVTTFAEIPTLSMSIFLKVIPPCKKWGSCILLWIIIVVTINSNTALGNGIIENKCDPTLFPKPYILLRETKNGPEINKLEIQGVVDLRKEIQRYICINGPVIIYSEASVEEETENVPNPASGGTGSGGVTVRFSNGTFKIFNHKCMSINRIPKFELDKLVRLGIEPQIDSTVEVIGMKATGIYLVASEEPYDPTWVLKVMLNQIGFGFETGPSETIISDASFIATGKGPYCLKLQDGSTVVLSSAANDDTEICRWSLEEDEDPNADYRRAFQKELDKTEYKWEDCPSDIMSTAPTIDPSNPPPGTGGPFSMLNPANVAPHGSRRGGKTSGGDDWPPADLDSSQMVSNSSCSLNPSDPACDQDPDFPTIEKDEEPEDLSAPPKNIFLTLENCEELPKFDASDPICETLKATTPTFDKITIALELIEDPAAPTKLLTLHANKKLKWKHEILDIMASIFSKICPAIRMQSVYQLMRVIDNYIATAHTAEPEVSEFSSLVEKSFIWDILTSRLKRCKERKSTLPMEWEWSISNVKIKKKKKKRDVKLDNFEEFLEQLGDDDIRPKSIFERSFPPLPDNDEDDPKNNIVYAKMPRRKRVSSSLLDDVVLPWTQEYFPPESDDTTMKHETFMLHPKPEDLRIKDFPDQQIFYYEDVVELELDLNPAIDAWWKIFASVIGYCQINEQSREMEIFSILFNNFDEYFLKPIKDKWLHPEGDLVELEMVLGEFLDEDRARWLDTCLETAYIISDSIHFRPARPLYFEGSKGVLEPNRFMETPENYEDQDGNTPNKYFTKKKLLFK
ncbi:unnamed protein product [Orchesella dallaii]|uniref:Uncharacterized protein n=1 Tax=Orchesella dallaii TaxID=48710 RepID=A0ABP1QAV1_9HEXA